MKKIEFDTSLRKLQKDSQNSSWEKALLGALLVSLLIYAVAMTYLFFRPTPQSTITAVDLEAQNQVINFNLATLKKLESRQVPAANTQTPSGKNPFTPF